MLAAGAGAVAFFLTGFVVGSYMDLCSSTFVLHRITGNFQGAIFLCISWVPEDTIFTQEKFVLYATHISATSMARRIYNELA